jgi:hypothetical protein
MMYRLMMNKNSGAEKTAHNEAVELIVFGKKYTPFAGFYHSITITLRQARCSRLFANPPSALASALRQYTRYAFPYVMHHAIQQPLDIYFYFCPQRKPVHHIAYQLPLAHHI